MPEPGQTHTRHRGHGTRDKGQGTAAPRSVRGTQSIRHAKPSTCRSTGCSPLAEIRVLIAATTTQSSPTCPGTCAPVCMNLACIITLTTPPPQISGPNPPSQPPRQQPRPRPRPPTPATATTTTSPSPWLPPCPPPPSCPRPPDNEPQSQPQPQPQPSPAPGFWPSSCPRP